MNRIFRYAFISFAFLFLVSSAAVVEAHGQLSEVLRRLEKHNQALKSVQANVTMLNFDPILGTTDTYSGSTKYLTKAAAGKMYMRLDWAQPGVEHISVMGEEYEAYKPGINTVYRGKTSQARSRGSAGNALSFLNMSREELRQNFTVTLVNEEKLRDGTPTAHLLLIPKGANKYKSSEIWVDKDGMPRQAKLTAANNDTSTVILEGIVKNASINTSIFKLQYDKKKVKTVNT